MANLTRRDFAKAGLAGAVTSVIASQRLCALGPTPDPRDPLWFVDPELRPFAREMQAAVASGKFPAMSQKTLPMLRQGMAGYAKPASGPVPVMKRSIPGRGGAPDVVIYVVNARAGARRPGILHTHGGGYVAGTAGTSVGDLQITAQALDCAIVSVDYRLAPETRYAGSIEDNYAGLLWLHAHADEIGVDTARLAVMGESAGGGHAALLAIRARDRGEVPLAFQCLIYPMLDDRTGSTRPAPAPIGALLWTAEANRFGWRSFLGVDPGGANVPAAGVPARVASVAGLPPAFIGVGSIDLFVQEDIAYADRLIAAGIATELLVVPGAFHGFDGIAADTVPARRFTAAKLAALRRALGATVA